MRRSRIGAYVRQHHLALLCLFLILGSGTAWAATNLSKDDVKSKHIKNRSVKTQDLAKGAVNSKKVADGSLRSADFARNQLPQGERGPQGPAGDTGPQGEPGQDATKLFGYIEYDPFAGGAIEVRYGSGVESVSRDGEGNYVVTFDRDLTNCAAQAVSGFGRPRGSGIKYEAASATVTMDPLVNDSQVRVEWRRSDGETNFGVPTDTSFFITAFC